MQTYEIHFDLNALLFTMRIQCYQGTQGQVADRLAAAFNARVLYINDIY